jgi:hypothetical protein
MGQRYALYLTFACMQSVKNRISSFAWLGFGLLYLLLPGINPSGDAVGYAGEFIQNAKTGAWLFSPHHLLYGPFGQITYGLIGKHFTHYLLWMQMLNAMAAAAALYLLKCIIELITGQKTAARVAVLLAGGAFATMRFATENETYMLPVLLSLWGTWFLIRFYKEPKIIWLYWGFGLLSLAVLFHQIHCWWWLAAALFFPAGKQKWGATSFSLGLILLAYFGAAAYQQKIWWQYPFSDALSATVNLIPGIDNLKFGIINSVRTWVQVHGNIPYFLDKWHLLWLFPALSTGYVVVAIIAKRTLGNNEKLQIESTQLNWLRFAFSFQFMWALYSVGNAEFMVMIPFLALLSFPGLLLKLQHKLLPLALAMLCWNMGVFLIPNAFIKTIKYGAELDLLLKIAEEDKADTLVFIAREKVMLENYLSIQEPYYQEKFRTQGIILLDADSINKPQKWPTYTDIYDYPMPTSRNSMLFKHETKKPEQAILAGSIKTLYGDLYLYKLYSKNAH